MADVIRNVKLRFTVEGAQSAKDAAAGVEKAVEKTGEAAKKTGGPGGGLTSLNDSLKQTTERFNRATSAIEGIMSGLARVAGAVGLVTGAFALLQSGAEKLNGLLFDTGDRFKVLTDEAVKAKTGLSNLQGSLDAYARSVGLANGKLLTFLERQRALRLIQSGQAPWTPELVEAMAQQTAEQRADADAAAARGETFAQRVSNFFTPGSGAALQVAQQQSESLGRRALLLDLVQQGYRQRQAAVDAFIADGGAGVDETAGGAGGSPVVRTGGGGRARAAAPASVPFWAANASEMLAGAQATASRVATEGTLSTAGGGIGAAASSALAALNAAQGNAASAYEDTSAALAGGLFDVERLAAVADQATATFDAFGRGFAQSAAAAALMGGNFKKVANEALKGLAVQATGEAAFQTAKGLAYLATGNVASATLAFDSAALFGLIAAGGIAGTAATGGFGGGKGGSASAARGSGRPPSRDDFGDTGRGAGGDGTTNVTVVIGGKAINDSVVAYSRGAAGSRSQPRVAVVQG